VGNKTIQKFKNMPIFRDLENKPDFWGLQKKNQKKIKKN